MPDLQVGNRTLLLLLAGLNGFAALPMFTHGLEWLAIIYLATSVYLMVGIDRNDHDG